MTFIAHSSLTPDSSQDATPLKAAAGQAIAACGGDMREAIKALIVANDFLETEAAELMRAMSQAMCPADSRPITVERHGPASPAPWLPDLRVTPHAARAWDAAGQE